MLMGRVGQIYIPVSGGALIYIGILLKVKVIVAKSYRKRMYEPAEPCGQRADLVDPIEKGRLEVSEG
jgi:hypothetical protein